MIITIKKLEEASRILEQDQESRQALNIKTQDFTEQFLRDLPDLPVFKKPNNEDDDDNHDIELGTPVKFPEILEIIQEKILKTGLIATSPGHFGYIPGSGLYASAIADFIAAVTNSYAGIYEACPGAVKIERIVVKWLAAVAGYPETAAGDLTSGGSIANLSAMVAAREAFGLKARDFEKTVVYLTEQTHHCIEKALRIAGLSECVIKRIPVDGRFRMKLDLLEKEIKSDQNKKRIPWLIIGNAGTTDTGAIDPLNGIADIAETYNIWFHVDGAYGASFMLSEAGKKRLSGIERSDSFVIDPHKGLFLPFGTGAVILRDGEKLFRAHQYQASYMQDLEYMSDLSEMSPAEMSPELTRHFRGLRLWVPLKLFGIAPFQAALDEKLLLAEYFHQEVKKIERMEVGPSPDLSIVIFRYVPEIGDANEFNKKLIEKIQSDGRIFISSTMIGDRFTLRMAILSYRSHLQQVNMAISVIKEMIEEVGAGS